MRRQLRPLLGGAAILAALAAPASAEIYRWVDEQGNVHFGDQPQDPAQAARAEPVEIQEAYRPPQRSATEQAAHEASLRNAREISARRREREQREAQERREREVAERDRQGKTCAAYRERLDTLTGIHTDDSGRPVRYYLEEDGKSVSAARQREIVAEIRAEMAAAGC